MKNLLLKPIRFSLIFLQTYFPSVPYKNRLISFPQQVQVVTAFTASRPSWLVLHDTGVPGGLNSDYISLHMESSLELLWLPSSTFAGYFIHSDNESQFHFRHHQFVVFPLLGGPHWILLRHGPSWLVPLLWAQTEPWLSSAPSPPEAWISAHVSLPLINTKNASLSLWFLNRIAKYTYGSCFLNFLPLW